MRTQLYPIMLGSAPRLFNVFGLPTYSTGINKVRRGSSSTRILCIGDSTVQGTRSNNTNTFGLRDLAWPAELQKLFELKGTTSSSRRDSLFGGGSGYSITSLLTYDPRWAVSGWVLNANSTVGGSSLQLGNGSSGDATFTPGGIFDTVDLWIDFLTANGGILEVVVNGVVYGTIDTAAATASTTLITISVPAGTSAVTLRRKSGNISTVLFIAGIAVRNASDRDIHIMNGGWHGSVISNWLTAGSPWNAYNEILVFKQCLTILCLNINDMNSGTAFSTYAAGITSLLSQAKLAGDVLLMTSVPSNPAGSGIASLAVQQTYVDAAISSAISVGASVLDIWRAYGGVYQSSLMYDDVHSNYDGCKDIAARVYARIGSP